MDTDELMTIPEAAHHLKIGISAVYQAIAEGRLRTVRVLGKRVIHRSEVEAYQPRSYAGRPGRAVGGRPKKNADTGQNS